MGERGGMVLLHVNDPPFFTTPPEKTTPFPPRFHPGSTTFTCRRLQDSSSAARSKAPEKPSKWSKDKRRHWPPVGMENGWWGWTPTTTTTTTTTNTTANTTATMYVSSKTRIEGVNEIIIWFLSSWRREEIATEASHENNQWWKSRWDTTTTITHCEFKNMIQHPPNKIQEPFHTALSLRLSSVDWNYLTYLNTPSELQTREGQLRDVFQDCICNTIFTQPPVGSSWLKRSIERRNKTHCLTVKETSSGYYLRKFRQLLWERSAYLSNKNRTLPGFGILNLVLFTSLYESDFHLNWDYTSTDTWDGILDPFDPFDRLPPFKNQVLPPTNNTQS